MCCHVNYPLLASRCLLSHNDPVSLSSLIISLNISVDLSRVREAPGPGLGHDHRGRPVTPRGLQPAGPRHQDEQVPHHQPSHQEGSNVQQLQSDAEKVWEEIFCLHA